MRTNRGVGLPELRHHLDKRTASTVSESDERVRPIQFSKHRYIISVDPPGGTGELRVDGNVDVSSLCTAVYPREFGRVSDEPLWV